MLNLVFKDIRERSFYKYLSSRIDHVVMLYHKLHKIISILILFIVFTCSSSSSGCGISSGIVGLFMFN